MGKTVRIGVVGMGNMGSQHARDLAAMEGAQLAAICDTDHGRMEAGAAKFGVRAFGDAASLLDAGLVDGIVIATPHYDHGPIAALAFRRGVGVLSEKPIAVTVRDARAMIGAYEEARGAHPGLVFSAMFQQRTQGNWMAVKRMLEAGELGRITRATWIVTDWFRTQAYYNSGGWRATWKGEGGGVLMNQCPHNLDLFQWFVGMPRRVTAHASLGKYHDIEVEDEVTAYFEYDDGMVGHFVTSTAEAPGTNRLEIVGENGKLVCEKGAIRYSRNSKSMLAHLREATAPWEPLPFADEDIPPEGPMEGNHRIVLADFAAALREARAPRIDGREGIAMTA
ncbi:MAG: Gfo/Idh/MocA family oxidoreductase, partial [Spirochaetaceae bacterium]|nr:Gfo/Idh/MocA family oxidoreductase [Spirochaetaceae bacterium]